MSDPNAERHVTNVSSVTGLVDQAFLSGLPVTPVAAESLIPPLSSAGLVYTYVTSSPSDGGLGIAPGASEWDLVDLITPLHDTNFYETRVQSWKLSQLASVKLGVIRDQVCSFTFSPARAVLTPIVPQVW
jgi:hypothetical protein